MISSPTRQKNLQQQEPEEELLDDSKNGITFKSFQLLDVLG